MNISGTSSYPMPYNPGAPGDGIDTPEPPPPNAEGGSGNDIYGPLSDPPPQPEPDESAKNELQDPHHDSMRGPLQPNP